MAGRMKFLHLTKRKIIKLSDIKPNFSELARFYDLDRRTVKSIMMDMKAKLLTEINQANWINIMISSNKSFLSEVRMSALCMSSFFLRGCLIFGSLISGVRLLTAYKSSFLHSQPPSHQNHTHFLP